MWGGGHKNHGDNKSEGQLTYCSFSHRNQRLPSPTFANRNTKQTT